MAAFIIRRIFFGRFVDGIKRGGGGGEFQRRKLESLQNVLLIHLLDVADNELVVKGGVSRCNLNFNINCPE